MNMNHSTRSRHCSVFLQIEKLKTEVKNIIISLKKKKKYLHT